MKNKDLILVVDDQINNLKVISSVLGDTYSLSLAQSGTKALEILKKVKPALILLDIMMPGMNGFEVCEKIKADENTKDIPVIFLTAKTDIEDIVAGFDYGAVDYITKPFNMKELIVRIQNHLNLANAKAEIIRQKNEIAEYNDQLIEAEKELTKENKEKDKFFSIIAHDLNSPLMGLVGYIKLINQKYDDINDTKKRAMLGRLLESAESLQALIANLLEWSRSKRGKIQLKPEMLNLADIANDVVMLLSNQSKEKNIEIINSIDNEFLIFADKNMLYTILRNLVSNAVKFSYEGGEILLEAGIRDNDTVFSVADKGMGIDDDGIKKLFRIDSDYSTLGTNNEQGTGLGLILCKEFVDNHNGSIWVESEKGKGSTFYCAFPYKNEH
jgi:signal transduction histidine kinase